jgi:hypothetical protein
MSFPRGSLTISRIESGGKRLMEKWMKLDLQKGKTLYFSRSRSQYLRRFAERPIPPKDSEIKKWNSRKCGKSQWGKWQCKKWQNIAAQNHKLKRFAPKRKLTVWLLEVG